MKPNFFVYYYLDINKETLYVGKTDKMNSRNGDHQRTKKWYKKVKEIYYFNYPDAPTQRMIEIYLINKLKAKHNTVHRYDVIPSIELELPDFIKYEPFVKINKSRVSNASKRAKISKIPKEPKITKVFKSTKKVKKNRYEESRRVIRNIKFEDIMWANRKIAINEITYVELEFADKAKKRFNKEQLNFFYYESDKFEDKEKYYFVIKDKKQIEIFQQSIIYLKLSGALIGGKGILYSSFYNNNEETLTFEFSKDLLEELISPIIPNINEFFSNLVKSKTECLLHR